MLFCSRVQKTSAVLELVLPIELIGPLRNPGAAMLVERGLQVLNVDVVADAYAIASDYLRRTGAISDRDRAGANGRLLHIILQMFRRGEFNKIRLANKAIARFNAAAGMTEVTV
jgi:hypothetical protein